jgi:cell division protein FtsQ
MSKSPHALPVARHWKDIPQEVKPRAVSKEGRRRALLRGIRLTGATVGLALAGAAAWEVTLAMERDAAPRPATRDELIGEHVVAESDGVLHRDVAWLKATLALPADATLDRIDLTALRQKVLAGGQVQAASVVRRFPHTLIVRMAERTPVARLRVAEGAAPERTLLVARDGTVYAGHGYDEAMLATLPWLDGITPHNGRVGPIAGMERVADLLSRARLEAGHLYRDWHVVSLAGLADDGIIEVRTRQGQTIRFGTQTDDFTQQLGRLDLALDTAARADPPIRLRTIDLSLGPRVPVSSEPVPTDPIGAPPGAGGMVRSNPAGTAAPAAPHFQFHLP